MDSRNEIESEKAKQSFFEQLAKLKQEKTGRVLSIQSHVVSGYVGNKSATLPLQMLSFDVDPLNSVHFSNHLGYKHVKGGRLDGTQLWEIIETLELNSLLNHSHILTGFIGEVSFLETVSKTVDKLRQLNPNLIYVCDPVLGDYFPQPEGEKEMGKLYVKQELLPVYKTHVLQRASILTPNQFEAELLSDKKIEKMSDALEVCQTLHNKGVQKVVITSFNLPLDPSKIFILSSESLSSASSSSTQFKQHLFSVKKFERKFEGTGDMLTACILAWSWKHPEDFQLAVRKAIASLQAVISLTFECDARELKLVQAKHFFSSPPLFFVTDEPLHLFS